MENEPCTAYELEPQPATTVPPIELSSPETEPAETPDISESSAPDSTADTADSDDSSETARREIDSMIKEMGPETLLRIIRKERNAACEQIKAELADRRGAYIPSGKSISRSCASIFDLASLARR